MNRIMYKSEDPATLGPTDENTLCGDNMPQVINNNNGEGYGGCKRSSS